MPEPTVLTRVVVGNMLALRRQRGWSAQELADRVTAAGYAVTQQAISKQETSQVQHITVDQLFAMAQVFDTPVEALTTTSASVPVAEQTRRETGVIGVGMPALLHLQAWAREIDEAFGHIPFLVGSAAQGKTWRDVDVRLMLPDEEFDALFPSHTKPDRVNGRWSLLCAAISGHGRARTGLPIDFQIQRSSDANAQYDGVRHALGLYPTWNA